MRRFIAGMILFINETITINWGQRIKSMVIKKIGQNRVKFSKNWQFNQSPLQLALQRRFKLEERIIGN